MKTETRQYKDVSGNPCSLAWLVKHEQAWAANQIRHRDKLERDLNQLLAAAKHLAECDCQSNYIKVPCVQCDAAHAIIEQCDVAAMPNKD